MSDITSFEAVDSRASLADIHPLLRNDISREGQDSEPEADPAIKEFLQHDLVRDQIAEAGDQADAPSEFVTAVLDTILSAQGPVTYRDICNHAETSNLKAVKAAARELTHRNIVFPQKMNGDEYVAFHHGGLEAVQRARSKQRIRAAAVDEF
ncbi:hypothetical protein [Haloarcula sp. Atlit-7R]|uniref:hypothetical protein n=1 Tax=Haloarcula sp. Atlit-7R TaxID=2282125 RepID=UPI000EF162EE|nr:hypothetical protein [Haloarcula sp. Atlit-7R]RLM94294.1 hypothetical protein D3D01_15640 [Haloarcula sp. Atlit-7R]